MQKDRRFAFVNYSTMEEAIVRIHLHAWHDVLAWRCVMVYVIVCARADRQARAIQAEFVAQQCVVRQGERPGPCMYRLRLLSDAESNPHFRLCPSPKTEADRLIKHRSSQSVRLPLAHSINTDASNRSLTVHFNSTPHYPHLRREKPFPSRLGKSR